MQFKDGAKVFTADGKEIGKVDRVVLNPRTKAVTHVVVHKGFLAEDKLIPIDLIATTTDNQVTLDPTAGDPNKLPLFEETHYIPITSGKGVDYATGQVRLLFPYPPVGMPLAGFAPPLIAQTERKVPPGTVALKEGARIVSADGQNVGKVERVLTDPKTDLATHLVISKGVFFQERRLIPVTWIEAIDEYKIRLAVDARLIDSLSAYQDKPATSGASS